MSSFSMFFFSFGWCIINFPPALLMSYYTQFIRFRAVYESTYVVFCARPPRFSRSLKFALHMQNENTQKKIHWHKANASQSEFGGVGMLALRF